VIVNANTIKSRRQRWLVHGLVPLRTMTLLAGVGGLGKSTYAIQLAANVTQGGEGEVLIVSFEDAAEEVIQPRLRAAGADLGRVGILVKEGGILTLPGDFPGLVSLIQERQVRLLIIDPVSAAISLRLDTHRDQDVRVVLGELERTVRRFDIAALLIGHLNKAPSSDAYIRINGSTGFYNACRSVVTVTIDPDEPTDHRLIAQHKSNYARLVPVQRHRLEEHSYWEGDEFIVTSKMVFVEDADGVDPYEVLSNNEPKAQGKRDEAETLLLAMLADREWHERDGIEKLVTARDVSKSTLERAAKTLGVESELRGFPARSWWRLPVASSPTSNDLTQQEETA
jgi:RecA-family ATPase